jgi:hypothetical protein
MYCPAAVFARLSGFSSFNLKVAQKAPVILVPGRFIRQPVPFQDTGSDYLAFELYGASFCAAQANFHGDFFARSLTGFNFFN